MTIFPPVVLRYCLTAVKLDDVGVNTFLEFCSTYSKRKYSISKIHIFTRQSEIYHILMNQPKFSIVPTTPRLFMAFDEGPGNPRTSKTDLFERVNVTAVHLHHYRYSQMMVVDV